MAGISGFTYEELTSSFHGSIGSKDASIVREFKIAWSQLGAFVSALRGGWSLDPSQASWSFTKGDRLSGVYSSFYCENVEFDSFGKAWRGSGDVMSLPIVTGDSSWEYAKVIATYKIPTQDYSMDPNYIMEETLEYDVDVMILPPGAFKKKGGNKDDVINLPSKLTVPCITWVIKLINRPTLPLGGQDALAEKAGRANSVPFRGASKGKVMFNGCKAERSFIAADAPLGYTITMPFKYRTIPWTHLFSPQEGMMVEVEPAKANGQPLVELFDFNTLFPSNPSFTINDPTPGTPGS